MNKIISYVIFLTILKILIYIIIFFSDVELVSTRISKKKSKRFKMPIRRRRLKRETNDSIHVKKHTTVKKKPTAKDQNLKKKKESECLTSNDLIDVAEFESPILRTAVDWFKSE